MRVLVADDMPMQMHILESLVHRLRPDWEVCAARDGREVLRLAREAAPNMILSDIRMPGMDGLELIDIVRREFPRARVAFITGYALFEYAQQALKRGASDILIKPVDEEAMEGLLRRLEEELSGERLEDAAARQLALNQWVGGPLALMGAESLPRVHRLFHGAGGWLAVVAPLHTEANLRRGGELWERATGALAGWPGAEVFQPLSETQAVLAALPGTQSDHAALLRLLRRLGAEQPLRVGLSFYADDLVEGGFEAARMARNALNEAFYRDEPLVSSQSTRRRSQISFPDAEALRALLFLPEEERAQRLERALDAVAAERPEKEALLDETAFAYAELLERLARETGDAPMFGELRMRRAGELRRVACFRDYRLALTRGLAEIARALASRREELADPIRRCLVYLGEHYAEPVSVSDMARHCALTPNYFSALFKKETGQRFTEYLSGLRLKKAEEQLLDTDQFVYEIAKRCGYENERYFIRVFQRAHGMTPSAYRKLRRKERP